MNRRAESLGDQTGDAESNPRLRGSVDTGDYRLRPLGVAGRPRDENRGGRVTKHACGDSPKEESRLSASTVCSQSQESRLLRFAQQDSHRISVHKALGRRRNESSGVGQGKFGVSLQKIRRVHSSHARVGGQSQVCRRDEAQLAVLVLEASSLLDRGHALGRTIDPTDDAPEKGGCIRNRVVHPTIVGHGR
jgi:hypothetical protein